MNQEDLKALLMSSKDEKGVELINTDSGDKKPDEVKLNEKLDAMQKGIDEKIEKLVDVTTNVVAKNIVAPAQQAAPANTEYEYDDSDVEENFTDGQQKLIQKMIGSAVSKAKDEALTQMSTKDAIKTWDDKAKAEFPELTNANSEFYKETLNEYNASPSKQSPDAVYNAAARVYARMARAGKIQNTDEVVRNYKVQNGQVQGSTPRPAMGNSDEKPPLTDAERYFAHKLKVKEEDYRKLRKTQ